MNNDDVLRSSDFPMPGFAPHGEIKLRYANGLLLWHLEGPFNAEAMRYFKLLRCRAIDHWPLEGRWLAGVVHWSGSALMAREAFEAYRDDLRSFLRGQQRLVAVAWAAHADVEGLAFMREPFERLYAEEGVAFCEFSDDHHAQDWARSQLSTCLQ